MPQQEDSGREGVKEVKVNRKPYYVSPYADEIRRVVSKHFGFTVHDIMKKSRKHDVVLAKDFIMYYLYKTNMSLPDISEYMGYANHTSILYGINHINSCLNNYDTHKEHNEQLITKLPQMTTIVALIGESGSGKTIAQEYISSVFGINKVISHTTRPRRTPEEKSHVFLTETEFSQLQGKIAEAKYGDYMYAGILPDDKLTTYVVDEQGLKMLRANKNLRVISIKIESDEDSCIKRVGEHRVKRCKSIKTYAKFDYICSNNGTIDEFYDKIRKIMIKIIENGTK